MDSKFQFNRDQINNGLNKKNISFLCIRVALIGDDYYFISVYLHQTSLKQEKSVITENCTYRLKHNFYMIKEP